MEFALEPKCRNLRWLQDFRSGEVRLHGGEQQTEQVGFLMHYINPRQFKESNPCLDVLDEDALEDLLATMLPVAQPMVLGSQRFQAELTGKLTLCHLWKRLVMTLTCDVLDKVAVLQIDQAPGQIRLVA